MVLHDAKDQFYAELEQKIKNKEIESEEFVAFLSSHAGEGSGFYELCSTFSDIGLNAPKWFDPKNCDVQALFQFKDIDIAKAAFKKYVAERQLTDYNGILDAVGIMHQYAVAWDDPRSKGGIVRPENYDWKPGFAGKYHNFCALPDDIWEKVKTGILTEIKD